VSGVSEEKIKEAFRIAAHKLPFTCKMVGKTEF
jgi:ribosomal protein L16/L10AE